VFGHDYVPHHSEAILPPQLVEDLHEQIPCPDRTKQRKPAIATAGDEMEVFLSLAAFEILRHPLRVKGPALS